MKTGKNDILKGIKKDKENWKLIQPDGGVSNIYGCILQKKKAYKHLKQDLKWELFDNLEHLRIMVAELLAQLTSDVAASLTGYDFILNALSVANIF